MKYTSSDPVPVRIVQFSSFIDNDEQRPRVSMTSSTPPPNMTPNHSPQLEHEFSAESGEPINKEEAFAKSRESRSRRDRFDYVFERAVTKRYLVLLTFVFSAVVFPLSLISLIAGMNKGFLEDYAIARVNTSEALESAIVVTTDSSNTKRDIIPRLVAHLPRVTLAPREGDQPSTLNAKAAFPLPLPRPLEFPNPFDASSSSTTASTTTTAEATSTSAQNSLQGFFNSIGGSIETGLPGDFSALAGGLSAILDNVTEIIGTDLEDAADELGHDLRDSLGIKQWYSLHLLSYCTGNYTPNGTVDNPGIATSNCTLYRDHKSTPSNISNDYITIGSLTVNYSALDLPAKLGSSGGGISGAIIFLDVLYGLAVGCSGLIILLSPLAFFTRLPLLVPIIAVLSGLCLAGIFGGSIITTTILSVGANLVNRLGSGLGVEVDTGSKFLVITWVAAALMLINNFLWLFQTLYYRRMKRRQLVKELRAQIAANEADRPPQFI